MEKPEFSIMDVAKVIGPAIAAVVAIAGFWGNLNATLTELKSNDATQTAQLLANARKMENEEAQLETISARLDKVASNQVRVMYRLGLHVPLDDPSRGYTCWPNCDGTGKTQTPFTIPAVPVPTPSAAPKPGPHSKLSDPFLVTERQQQTAGEFPGVFENRPIQ